MSDNQLKKMFENIKYGNYFLAIFWTSNLSDIEEEFIEPVSRRNSGSVIIILITLTEI